MSSPGQVIPSCDTFKYQQQGDYIRYRIQEGDRVGYYKSLLERKFRDRAGAKYEIILQEYKDFLPGEQELAPFAIHSILMPVDMFVESVPGYLTFLLEVYEAPALLVYIIDDELLSLIRSEMNDKEGEEFLEKREIFADERLKKISSLLEFAGIRTLTQRIVGNKEQNIISMSEDHDLLAISRHYGFHQVSHKGISPTIHRIRRQVEIPLLLY